jgi:hypothetical protein
MLSPRANHVSAAAGRPPSRDRPRYLVSSLGAEDSSVCGMRYVAGLRADLVVELIDIDEQLAYKVCSGSSGSVSGRGSVYMLHARVSTFLDKGDTRTAGK